MVSTLKNTALLLVTGVVALWAATSLVGVVQGGEPEPPGPPTRSTGRTPIFQPDPGGFPIVIGQPGSYYLAENITGEAGEDGIQITTGAVTLDLNGFTLMGVPGSLNGVHVTCSAACYLIQIHGGNVAGWGQDGIDMGPADGGEITGVQVSGNSGDGIAATGSNTVVSDCIVGGNGGDGVDAGSSGVIVRNSLIGYNGGSGIVAGGSTVEDNHVAWNGGHGISVAGGFIARNNSSGNGQNGFLVTAGWSLITDNNAGGNQGKGFEVLGSGNLVARNTAGDNGAPLHLNYVIAAGDVGPIGFASTSTSAWANISDYSY